MRTRDLFAVANLLVYLVLYGRRGLLLVSFRRNGTYFVSYPTVAAMTFVALLHGVSWLLIAKSVDFLSAASNGVITTQQGGMQRSSGPPAARGLEMICCRNYTALRRRRTASGFRRGQHAARTHAHTHTAEVGRWA